jgi:hypothetical protein
MKMNPTLASLLAAALMCASAPRAASEDIELPDRTVIGKSGGAHSSFSQLRDRSRAVLNFKPKVKYRNPNLAAQFVGEATVAGAQIWAYPDGSGYPMPAMTDAQAKEGKYALEVNLKPDAYAGGAVCSPSPLDLTPYIDKGALELWVKGAEGKEVFSIGLLDNGNNPVGRPLQVWVSSRSYGRVMKDEWRKIVIPLKAFGARGSYWSEEINARVFNALNWSAISCFSFDIDKERFKSFKVWMDEVLVSKRAPKNAAGVGEGYKYSNEDFEDFPTATKN